MFWYWFDELCMITSKDDAEDEMSINDETLEIWAKCPFSLRKLIAYIALS